MATEAWSVNNSARANEIWARLAGCFGDSLIRKFGSDPPGEWVTGISMLNDYQIRQGMRRLLFSGMSHAPTLPEFMKLCRAVGHLDGVPDLPPPSALAQEVTADRWTLAGNRRLLGEITRRITPPGTNRYGRGCSAAAMSDGKRSDDKILDASPQFVSSINTLVAMKNRWVDLMQLAATEEGVPPDEQNQCWRGCMRQAEEIITAEHA